MIPSSLVGIVQNVACAVGQRCLRMDGMKIPTKDEMAQMLAGLNVADVAKASGLSEKTIYRLRWKQTRPSLETLERLSAALPKRKPKGAPAVKQEA